MNFLSTIFMFVCVYCAKKKDYGNAIIASMFANIFLLLFVIEKILDKIK